MNENEKKQHTYNEMKQALKSQNVPRNGTIHCFHM